MSQEGAMVLVQVHKSVLRVNQSKVRRDHDPWHDVAIPLNPEPEVKEEGAPDRSVFSEGTGHHCSCCYEHEISYHTYTEKRSDFVEISASASGLTACVARSGMLAGVPILGEQFNMKKVQQSISQAWKTIANNDPEHVIIHPVVPKQWNEKATKAFWKFCADVARWQDNRGCFVTIIYPRGEGFWSSQGCRSLLWRYSFHSEELSFSRDPKVWSLTLKSNLPEGTFGRLHALDRFSGDDMSLDPRFVVLMTSCLIDQCVSDHRQECLFEDLLEDFDDGSLCALSLRSDRNNDALSAIPTKEEFSALGVDRGKLPKGLQFVSPQRFVTSSLVQALGEIDRLLPGTELEIHTSTSKQALSLKPSLKSVRVLTLPHMEFEFCNVYRGTFGKTLPLLQRHPDAVVVLWNPNDYDHVFFVTLSQLVPCLKQMNADHWSMIVFWSEGTKTRPSTSPDVGLDYTDEPVPLPPPDVPPQTDGTGNDDDTPGPSGYQDPVVPDENMPYGDPGDDSPDLGGPEAVLLDRDRDLLVIREEMTLTFRQVELSSSTDLEAILHHTILEAVRLCRCQMIVIHPWSSYLTDLMAPHQMMTIRHIQQKFIRSFLLQEDLRMRQGQNSLLRTRTKLCNRHLTCHKPFLNRLFHFRISRFRESCVRRHRGMFR